MENPLNFLKKKYNLHNTPEVKKSAQRTEFRDGEKVPQNPAQQIQNYLDRFKEILDREDPEKRSMGIEALKKVLHKNFVIKEKEIPESYFDNQARIAREQGHGDVDITNEQKQQLAEVIITDQKSSLDTWVDYLSSSDATYPDWLKYYSVRSVLSMGSYDKEKKEFSKRSVGTTKPFPDLNREALAYVLDAIEKKSKDEKINLSHLEGEEKEKFEKLLQGENFAKLYAWAIEKLTPASQEQLAITKGSWIKYEKGSDHMPLVESLQGHGTGWCTAGESTAKSQLQQGDFYVYYSETSEGDLEIPRAAIRMQDGKIAEVRGIAEQQNLDPYVADIVKEKMHEFPDGKQYEKKSEDMKKLTYIENKSKLGTQLDRSDLRFLYEMDSAIEGFGYQKDPRIAEILSTRNPMDDAPVIFDCKPDQIANTIDQVNEKTVAYIGPWNIEVYQKMPDTVKYLYESFPETKIFKQSLELSTKTPEQYTKELIDNGNQIYSYAQQILNKIEALKSPEQISLVSFSVEQLGFPNGATLQEIYDKAQSMGLELCPPQVGPELRLSYTDQPNNEYLVIAMEAITDADGDPLLFSVNRNVSGPCLGFNRGRLDRRWNGINRFVFRSRKS
jgi:hypothetical protein